MVTLVEACAMEMEVRKEPEFVTFQKGGDFVGGVLVGVEKIQLKHKDTNISKPAVRFTLEEIDTGRRLAFLGTYQLATMLRCSDIGKVVAVRYTGKRDTPNGAMTTFDVQVSRASPPVRTRMETRFRMMISDSRPRLGQSIALRKLCFKSATSNWRNNLNSFAMLVRETAGHNPG